MNSVWEATTIDVHQWVQVSFTYLATFDVVAIRGSGDKGAYVTAFYLEYSQDGVHWEYFLNEFNQPWVTISSFERESSLILAFPWIF